MAKKKKAVYFIREAKELFDRTAAFMALTIYTLAAHVSGKHKHLMTEKQAKDTLYKYMGEINRNNNNNRCAAIPERDKKGFVGIRRIPPTPEGRAIILAYREKRFEELNKLINAQIEIVEADRIKGILTEYQVEKLTNTTLTVIEEHGLLELTP